MSVPLFSDASEMVQKPLSISQLTMAVKNQIEPEFEDVWVVGEISNCKPWRSGHIYLTLKDNQSQLRSVIWKGVANRLRFEMEDGLEVVARGHLEVYSPRGEYSLIIEQIHPKGLGTLELAFRQLREKLQKEGLFDSERKTTLPFFPERIVLVTSPSGAAVRDLLQVILRRMPGSRIWVSPVRVQGEGAASEIVDALTKVDSLNMDVVILARGGGSLEDLWCFNEESVVRTIAGMKTPVVTAIGHEVDVTLSDLVADQRALTPSEAGELVVPDRQELSGWLTGLYRQLTGSVSGRIKSARMTLDALASRPVLKRPQEHIYRAVRECDEWGERARRAVITRLSDSHQEMEKLSRTLESLSPVKVLGRGYSLTYSETTKTLLKDPFQVGKGDSIRTYLSGGEVLSRVEEVRDQKTVDLG